MPTPIAISADNNSCHNRISNWRLHRLNSICNHSSIMDKNLVVSYESLVLLMPPIWDREQWDAVSGKKLSQKLRVFQSLIFFLLLHSLICFVANQGRRRLITSKTKKIMHCKNPKPEERPRRRSKAGLRCTLFHLTVDGGVREYNSRETHFKPSLASRIHLLLLKEKGSNSLTLCIRYHVM